MQSKSVMNELMDKLKTAPKVQSMEESLRRKDGDAVGNYLGAQKAMRSSVVQISMPVAKEPPKPEAKLEMDKAMGIQPG